MEGLLNVGGSTLELRSWLNNFTQHLCDLPNMDQTPLPLILDDGTRAPKIFVARAVHQVLRNFKQRLKSLYSLMVFLVSNHLSYSKAKEEKAWDSRVTVFFQENTWCDEQTMVKWIQSEWNNLFHNLSTPGSDGKILVADIHRAQQTENVKRLLARCKTKLVNVPGCCTSLVHPVDEPFKGYVRAMSERHLNENFEKYTEVCVRTASSHDKMAG